MEFTIVLNQVITLFVILVVGFVAGKFKVMDEMATKRMSEVLLYVTSPLLVFNSFFIEFTKERLINIFWMLGTASAMFILSIVLSKFIYARFNENLNPVLRFTAIFSNCSYMGLPLIKALFGDEGVFFGSFYNVAFYVALWSYGYIMFGGKGTRKELAKKALLNPSMISIYAGILVFIFGISLPDPVRNAVQSVGNMTMPISMLIIGGVMSTSKLTTLFTDWRVYLASAIRLIAMPLLALGILLVVGVPALPASVVVTALAMPCAATTTIFSKMFNKDAVFASKCVTVSTLLSILTAPVIIAFAIGHLM